MQRGSYICYSAVPSLRCINIAIARAFRKGDWRSGYYRTPVFGFQAICFSVQKALLEVRFVGYLVYAPCGAQRLELPTSTMNDCVLSILIATLLQHLTDLNKKLPPRFRWRRLRISATRRDLGIFALFSSKIACFFVVLTGLEPVTSPM